MMDCKKALQDPEVDGNIEDAMLWLRKHAQVKAEKLSTRKIAQGIVGVSIGSSTASIIEVGTETDFVAMGDHCRELAETLALSARKNGTVEVSEFLQSPCADGTVAEAVTEAVSVVRENIQIRRLDVIDFDSDTEVVGSYMHQPMNAERSVGTNAALVTLRHASPVDDAGKSELQELATQLAMHVVAARPGFLSAADIPEAKVEREREFLTEEARNSGKPEKIIENMVKGRMKNFYKEHCLLDQMYVVEPKKSVQAVLAEASKRLGVDVLASSFLRYQRGENANAQDS